MLSVKQEAENINFKVIGLTRLGIKPESTVLEADTFTSRPYGRLNFYSSASFSFDSAFYYVNDTSIIHFNLIDLNSTGAGRRST